MPGDERVRFCPQCDKHVYNLSALDAAAAQSLIQEHEGLCVRFYRRSDGSILTSDCPVGSRRLHRRLLTKLAAILVVCLFGWTMGLTNTRRPKPDHPIVEKMRAINALKPVVNWLFPLPPPKTPSRDFVTMGKICLPPK
jgi:hypothetical protein